MCAPGCARVESRAHSSVAPAAYCAAGSPSLALISTRAAPLGHEESDKNRPMLTLRGRLAGAPLAPVNSSSSCPSAHRRRRRLMAARSKRRHFRRAQVARARESRPESRSSANSRAPSSRADTLGAHRSANWPTGQVVSIAGPPLVLALATCFLLAAPLCWRGRWLARPLAGGPSAPEAAGRASRRPQKPPAAGAPEALGRRSTRGSLAPHYGRHQDDTARTFNTAPEYR